MTYLDPNHARTRTDWAKWAFRAVAAAVIAGLGWMALTIGSDENGAPEIVPEPVTRSF